MAGVMTFYSDPRTQPAKHYRSISKRYPHEIALHLCANHPRNEFLVADAKRFAPALLA